MFHNFRMDTQIHLKFTHHFQNMSQDHIHVLFHWFILDNLSLTICHVCPYRAFTVEKIGIPTRENPSD